MRGHMRDSQRSSTSKPPRRLKLAKKPRALPRLQFSCGCELPLRSRRRLRAGRSGRNSSLHSRATRSLRTPRPTCRRRTLPDPDNRPPTAYAPSSRSARIAIQTSQPSRKSRTHRILRHGFSIRIVTDPLRCDLYALWTYRGPPPAQTPHALLLADDDGERLPSRLLHQQTLQTRARSDVWPIPLAPRGRALLRCRARSLQTPPLLRRPRTLPRASRLRLRRDGQVHRALQTSLHARAIRRRSGRGKKILRYPRREYGH